SVSFIITLLLPGTVVRAEGGLAAFGNVAQRCVPRRVDGELRRVGTVPVQRLAPDAGNLFDIRRTALATFDLHRNHADLGKLGNQFDGIQAGRLFQGVETLAVYHEAPLAQGRIACGLTGLVVVDQDVVEP